MGDECSSNINVPIDCIFTIRIDSQFGSTGFSWALACMPDSVNLLGVSFETSQSHSVGCSETQVFTFVAVAYGEYKICFNLLRAWEPEKIADQKKFTVTIEENNDTANELQQTAGCKKIASFGDACGSSGITVVASKDNNDDSCT